MIPRLEQRPRPRSRQQLSPSQPPWPRRWLSTPRSTRPRRRLRTPRSRPGRFNPALSPRPVYSWDFVLAALHLTDDDLATTRRLVAELRRENGGLQANLRAANSRWALRTRRCSRAGPLASSCRARFAGRRPSHGAPSPAAHPTAQNPALAPARLPGPPAELPRNHRHARAPSTAGARPPGPAPWRAVAVTRAASPAPAPLSSHPTWLCGGWSWRALVWASGRNMPDYAGRGSAQTPMPTWPICRGSHAPH